MDKVMKGGCVMPVWSIQGEDVKTGQQRWEKIEAGNETLARSAAERNGLKPIVVTRVNATPTRASGIDPNATALGLTHGQAFWVAIVGLFLAPFGAGILLIVWAVVARSHIRNGRGKR